METKPDLTFSTRELAGLDETGEPVVLCEGNGFQVVGQFDPYMRRFSIYPESTAVEWTPARCNVVVRDETGAKLYDVELADGTHHLEPAALRRLAECYFTIEVHIGG